jgi:hypothetical protein
VDVAHFSPLSPGGRPVGLPQKEALPEEGHPPYPQTQPCGIGPEERGAEVLEVKPARGGGSYVLQKVKCGKDHCRCSKPMHGPYWYLFTKTAGKTKSKYIGKDKPAGT